MRALMLVIVFAAYGASQADNCIFILNTADNPDGYNTCWADIGPFQTVDIYIFARPDLEDCPSGIIAAEFKIDNWMESPGYPDGQTVIDYTGFVEGDLATDLTITWVEPQTNAWVLIAKVSVTSFSDDWIDHDYEIRPVNGDACGCIIVVDDTFNDHPANGMPFVFNPWDPWMLWCRPPQVVESSWSSVKALF